MLQKRVSYQKSYVHLKIVQTLVVLSYYQVNFVTYPPHRHFNLTKSVKCVIITNFKRQKVGIEPTFGKQPYRLLNSKIIHCDFAIID